MEALGLEHREFRTVDLATISYYRRPGPDPYVLIHGFGYGAEMWRAVIEALPGRPGILAVDIRGHGRSTLGSALPAVDLWAQDVLALIQEEAIRHPAICGLSMGGYTTLAIAAIAAKRCRGFAFVSTAATADDATALEGRASGIELLRTAGVGPFCDGLLPRLLWPDHPDHERLKTQARMQFERAGAVSLVSTLLALANRPDRLRVLPGLRQPAVVVVGDKDILTPLAKAEQITARLMNGELHVVEDAAHMSAVEQPEAVARALAGL